MFLVSVWTALTIFPLLIGSERQVWTALTIFPLLIGSERQVWTALTIFPLLIGSERQGSVDSLMGIGSYILSDNDTLPAFVALNVSVNGSDIHLDLEINTDIDPAIPVYVLSTDNSGTEHLKQHELGKEQVVVDSVESSLYRDKHNTALFRIFRQTDQNGTASYKLDGIIHHLGKDYTVESAGPVKRRSKRAWQDTGINKGIIREDYFRFQEMEDSTASEYDALENPTNYHTRIAAPNTRFKREITQDVHVDVVALIDYAIYLRWFNRSTTEIGINKDQAILQNIQQYFAFVFNGVNMMYRTITTLSYIIHVHLSGIVVSMTASNSNWTERFRQSATPTDTVDASNALESFAGWASTTSVLPQYDHLMLITGYDLSKTEGNLFSNSIAGLAYTGSLCDRTGRATSVVEDRGGFQSIKIAAHELGHRYTLSAQHDGTTNNCSAEDRYIMSPTDYKETEQNKLNPWKFSNCSQVYFHTFISNKILTEDGPRCLFNMSVTETSLPNITSLMPGQIYNAHEQCRQVFGSGSYMCQNIANWTSSDVCTSMYCFKTETVSSCSKLVAASGTTCGNKKWCIDGQCVYADEAPAVNENCVFGDSPGLISGMTCTAYIASYPGHCYNNYVGNTCCQSCANAYNAIQVNCEYGDHYVTVYNETCSVAVSWFPGYCYDEKIKLSCCLSCAKVYTPVQGCQYGDQYSNCLPEYCKTSVIAILQDCCGTCKYGSTITAQPTSIKSTTTTASITSASTNKDTYSTAQPTSIKTITTTDGITSASTSKDTYSTAQPTSINTTTTTASITSASTSKDTYSTAQLTSIKTTTTTDGITSASTSKDTYSTAQPTSIKTITTTDGITSASTSKDTYSTAQPTSINTTTTTASITSASTSKDTYSTAQLTSIKTTTTTDGITSASTSKATYSTNSNSNTSGVNRLNSYLSGHFVPMLMLIHTLL